ncbi:TPA: helix-turn-helix domain-containing protein [Escherichia coli]|uniref:helix-turn-helix domain-containing protein n=1 Tax=Escherichia coli TaxID=562 RepID=UPI000C01666F|nr:helix-turn-helix domain-containing protein [Escherichia coli]PGF72432.1 AraC family transcriptional regulator [Escherichia coli]UUH77348.1 helix-turn-helix domain-containing protein [Escherichia coli]WOY33140.1 helix-turn-helix domain-containing protein [Escherichia coli]HAX7839326.1 helix-turn-helix domain-containing protein [Escherichia coli]HBA5209208.1 helix-turn-helix domain-containing protein [Escherichia coli]
MPCICSIILVLNSFDIRLGKEKISLKKGSVVAIEYNLKVFFSSNKYNIMIVDIEEKTVNDFFKNNTLSPFSVRRFYSAYLIVNCTDYSLLKNLIGCLNCDGETTAVVKNSILFACLAILSSEKMFQSFLFGCLNSLGSKVKAIIHSDISAAWRLCDISSRLCLSESLLKRKLKHEGLSFSKLILEERMVMAERLLSYNFYPVGEVAKICGYESASYFISVFRRYFGVPPHEYSSRFFLEKGKM